MSYGPLETYYNIHLCVTKAPLWLASLHSNGCLVYCEFPQAPVWAMIYHTLLNPGGFGTYSCVPESSFDPPDPQSQLGSLPDLQQPIKTCAYQSLPITKKIEYSGQCKLFFPNQNFVLHTANS